MAQQFTSARMQAMLNTPTGYRRRMTFTFSRAGLSRTLEPIAGSLTQDARRGARWDGRMTFTGDDVLPRRPSDLLTPFGTTVTASLGLELLNGQTAYLPCGTYEIASSTVRTDAGTRVVDVALIDVSDSIDRYRMEQPLTVASGTDLATMINTVITNRTGLNPLVTAVGAALGAARTFGLDAATGPWAEILDVLDGFSRKAWYDRSGDIVVGNLTPDPLTAYALDTLTSLSIDYDTRPANVIVARGEAQDGTAPVQAVAYDTDPSSPTYAGTGPGTSPYGRTTEFFSSPLIKTVAQAQATALTLLGQRAGQGATYTLVRPYDPTIDAGDVVSHSGITLAVDAVTINLTGDTEIKAREI